MMSEPRATKGFLLGPVSRGNPRGQVTSQRLTGIFPGHFPPNEWPIVRPVAEAFEVSPTPVREALVEIAYLGLVDMLPNRGAVVRAIGQLRRLLGPESARRAVGRLPVERWNWSLSSFSGPRRRRRGPLPGPSC